MGHCRVGRIKEAFQIRMAFRIIHQATTQEESVCHSIQPSILIQTVIKHLPFLEDLGWKLPSKGQFELAFN
ncbi:hypothetical protein Lal_00030116 [Lupinus albus]|nr:hypothetical protein Lal_00030116 [Lupinus albus]